MIEQLEQRVLMSATFVDGVLTITGTNKADDISLGANGSALGVTLNGVDQIAGLGVTTANVKKINILGLRGDDLIIFYAGIGNYPAFPVFVNAGAGNDRVQTGFGDDTILGGNGNDTINGMSGDDVLFGGKGRDVMDGGSGEDLLADDTGKDLSGQDELTITGKLVIGPPLPVNVNYQLETKNKALPKSIRILDTSIPDAGDLVGKKVTITGRIGFFGPGQAPPSEYFPMIIATSIQPA